MQNFNEKDLPAYVLPLYRKVIATPNGKSALKRLCIFCGICKSKKFYSLTRAAIKIGDTLSCDSCHNLYLNSDESNKVKLKCNDHATGSTFLGGTFVSPKCKACRLLQILTKCQMSEDKYSSLYERLSNDCKKLAPSGPISKTPTSSSNGFVRLQYYVGDKWLDVSDQSPLDEDSAMDVDSGSDQCSEMREESENSGTNPPSPEENDDSNSGFNFEYSAAMDIYEEEAMIDDPEPIEEDSYISKEPSTESNKFKEHSVKSSERIKKKKKVDYIVGRKSKKCIHGPDGVILKNDKDLCDCLQNLCPGCHFPCPKCRSPKCGNDCRVNRRWYYDKVEIEGTNISWENKWVQKV